MEFRELLLMQHARAHAAEVGGADQSFQDYILAGLSEDQMRQRPEWGPGQALNSLAWLFWHMTRAEDIGMNLILAQGPQVAETDDWIKRLRVPRWDIATGMTDLEVDEVSQQIDIPALLAYRAAVGRQTQEAIRVLRPEILDEIIDDILIQKAQQRGVFGPHAQPVIQRWTGKRKAYILTHTLIGHAFIHIGQADTVRYWLGLPTI